MGEGHLKGHRYQCCPGQTKPDPLKVFRRRRYAAVVKNVYRYTLKKIRKSTVFFHPRNTNRYGTMIRALYPRHSRFNKRKKLARIQMTPLANRIIVSVAPPAYPDRAREMAIEGTVIVTFVVNEDGKVGTIEDINLNSAVGCGAAAAKGNRYE